MKTQRKPVVRVRIIDEDSRRRAIDAVMRCNSDEPMEIEIKRWEPRRTLSANNLYWAWLRQMAKHFSQTAGPFNESDMHDLMRHQHLGYTTPKRIGKTPIGAQLRSTSGLTKGEMLEYMQRIDAWAADHSLLLKRPENSEYEELARRQEA